MEFKLNTGKTGKGAIREGLLAWEGFEHVSKDKKGKVSVGPRHRGEQVGNWTSGIFWRAEVVGGCEEAKSTALPLPCRLLSC